MTRTIAIEQTPPDVVIYHHPCLDGFTGAWAIRRRWPDAKIRFLQGAYGKQPTTLLGRTIGFEEFRGKNVVLVDFTMSASDLLRMGELAHSVTVLDHHESAAIDLSDFVRENDRLFDLSMEDFGNNRKERVAPRVRARFDMDHSGAYLAWAWAHGVTSEDYVEIPILVQYIEDQDMWWKRMPAQAEIIANIAGYDWTFENWNEIYDRLEDYGTRDAFIQEGIGALRRYQKLVRAAVDETQRTISIEVGELLLEVPACNVPHAMASDACERLHALEPNAAFVLAYYEDGDGSL